MVYTIIAGNVSAPSVCQSTNWGRLLHLYGGISHFNVWHFPREAARKAPYPISYTVGEKALSGLVSVRRKRGPAPPTAPPPIQSQRRLGTFQLAACLLLGRSVHRLCVTTQVVGIRHFTNATSLKQMRRYKMMEGAKVFAAASSNR